MGNKKMIAQEKADITLDVRAILLKHGFSVQQRQEVLGALNRVLVEM